MYKKTIVLEKKVRRQASGKSFSFAVEGDLDQNELKDLSTMLRGIDKIVSEVVSGDMDGAVNKAQKLTGYDSFSAYSVDISYEAYYAASSSTAAMASESSGQYLPEQDGENKELAPPSAPQFPSFDNFFGSLMEELNKYGEDLLASAKNPLNQLFKHHLGELEDDTPSSVADMVEKAMNQVDSFLDKILTDFSAPVEEE